MDYRTTEQELREFLVELAERGASELGSPGFWTSTPTRSPCRATCPGSGPKMVKYVDGDIYMRKRQLRQCGIPTDTGYVRLHSSNETLKHAVSKLMVAVQLQRRNIPWNTEVDLGAGRADVLSWGPPDGYACVYEFETNCSPKRIQVNTEKYADPHWIIRDAKTIDLAGAPDSISELYDWLGEHVTP